MSNSAGLRLRIDPELRTNFIKACRKNDLTASQVLRGFIRNYVDGNMPIEQIDLFQDLSKNRRESGNA